MKKVIIDVDTGIDDALAIILAINSNRLDILGITTVAGNVPVELATKNTLRVLKLLGREDIEVYEGADKPIEREIRFRGIVYGSDGLGGQLNSMETKLKSEINAVKYIIDEINAHPGEITIITLSPLTNLALAIEEDPSIVGKIKDIYIMGGAVGVAGNITPVSEFNFYTDPESAYNVIHSGLNIKLIGLNVTEKARFSENDLKNKDRMSEYENFIDNILRFYMDRMFEIRGYKSCALHDPLVVAVAIEEIVEYEKCFVDLEYSSRISDGQLVKYFNRDYKENVELAISIDIERFKKIFLENVYQ